MKEALMGVVRHAFTTFGGALVASGMVTTSDLEVIGGAVATIVGVLWSIYEKHTRV